MKSGFAIGAYTPCNQLLWICTAIEAIKLQTFYVAPEDVTMYGIYAMATIYTYLSISRRMINGSAVAVDSNRLQGRFAFIQAQATRLHSYTYSWYT